MRIVITRREPLDIPDGVNISIVSLAHALEDQGHSVKLVTGSLNSREEFNRLLAPRRDLSILALSRAPLAGLASIRAWLRARREIHRFRPDLIIHNEAMPLPFRSNVAHVIHDLQARSGMLAPVRRMIRRYSTRRSQFVIAATTELRDALSRDLAVPANRIEVIPECLDRQAYGGLVLDRRERAILHAGTASYKDPGATIRAFGALNDPSVRLYVVGPVTGETQAALDLLPGRLQRCVSLLGDADGDAVRRLHGRVRVAAFPTRYTTPVASATVMEALASGTPIVGSRRLSRDIIVDGRNGLVTPTAAGAMAAAFARILDDDALWSQLSAGALDVIERFDAGRIAHEYVSLAQRASPQPSLKAAPQNLWAFLLTGLAAG
jgi:glycosyltransferase involved in cell wall biosynthesis